MAKLTEHCKETSVHGTVFPSIICRSGTYSTAVGSIVRYDQWIPQMQDSADHQITSSNARSDAQ